MHYGVVGLLSGEGAGGNPGKQPGNLPLYLNGVRAQLFEISNPLLRASAVGDKLTGGLGAKARFIVHSWRNYFVHGVYDATAGAGGVIATAGGSTSIATISQDPNGHHDFPTRAWVNSLPGKAVVGNSLATWVVTGTRHGAIDA